MDIGRITLGKGMASFLRFEANTNMAELNQIP